MDPAPVIGSPRVHHRLTNSTNARARELAQAGAPHGTLVTATEQSAGRGRQGRVWSAPPGRSLLMSVVLNELDERSPLMTLAAAVAVCEACDADCSIKWPNDVWVDRRKLAGILVEGRPQEGWAVLGIGLNVVTLEDEFPDELREIATSLHIAGSDTTVEQTLDAVIPALDRWLSAETKDVLDAWRERDALEGERIGWEGGEGVAAGIDDSGSLLVETDDGVVRLGAGEVHLRHRAH
jgi:BirA family biotin operon repressor/biotin-[acetyl-CoA-carboxylase] ligase